MNGMELAHCYYEQFGKPALEKQLPQVLERAAVGLAGEGSQCLGFDDLLSRDHDWGPGFCIWLDESDYQHYGIAVQQLYDNLPKEVGGAVVQQASPYSGKRVGCLCTQQWYRRYTGLATGPMTLEQWRRVPEAFLATATNGEVFHDPTGRFTAIRNRLKGFYPEDIRLKKLAARAAVMAQAGQYNYSRCSRRGDTVAAQLALSEFMKAAMSMIYLLAREYAPYYKWMHRGLKELSILPRSYAQFEQLMQAKNRTAAEELIEGICLTIAAELRRQSLSACQSSFMQDYCVDLMQNICDPTLRETHFMEE